MFIFANKDNINFFEEYILHDDVYGLFEPNTKKEDFKLFTTPSLFILGYTIGEDNLNGVLVCEIRSNYYINFHFLMHKKHRENKYNMMRDFESFIKQNFDVRKLTCEFPAIYDNLKFAIEKAGYNFQGLNEKSYNLHGKILDQLIYGKVL